MTEVLFNHFFVTPDLEGFEAAERFLEGFGALEKRTTVRRDMTYTGLYLYGDDTYLELLHPASSSFGAPSGIAYGVETPGAIDAFQKAMQSATVEEISRGDVPWFRLCRPEQLTGLAEWAMEYRPEFFRGFHPELPPARPGIARSDALTRYAASCGKLAERERGLFGDVTGLDVALGSRDLERWKARPLQVAGADLRVALGRPGIRTARLRLRRDAGRAVHRFGNTTLSLDGKSAVWRFD